MPTPTRLHPPPVVVHDRHENDAALRPPRPRPWLDRAACVDVAITVFYPEDGGDLMEALLICGSCPVRAECLEHAIATREWYGIWGGTTPEQRRTLAHEPPAEVNGGADLDLREEAS